MLFYVRTLFSRRAQATAQRKGLLPAAVLIIITDLQKAFQTPGADVVALKDINLTIRQGEFVCLIGPSGCGKSALLKLGLTEFRDRFPKDLSGGMRQRVAIARILAIDSPIMLMDEPFGALDALTRRNLQDELLRIWKESGKTIIFVTHSIEESLYLADRIIVMTYRPGTIKREQLITMPRPRDPAGAEFNDLKRDLGTLVMEEQARHAQAEQQLGTID